MLRARLQELSTARQLVHAEDRLAQDADAALATLSSWFCRRCRVYGCRKHGGLLVGGNIGGNTHHRQVGTKSNRISPPSPCLPPLPPTHAAHTAGAWLPPPATIMRAHRPHHRAVPTPRCWQRPVADRRLRLRRGRRWRTACCSRRTRCLTAIAVGWRRWLPASAAGRSTDASKRWCFTQLVVLLTNEILYTMHTAWTVCGWQRRAGAAKAGAQEAQAKDALSDQERPARPGCLPPTGARTGPGMVASSGMS